MCTWPGNDSLMQAYHDHEWGVPVTDDKVHFEFLILESFQADFRGKPSYIAARDLKKRLQILMLKKWRHLQWQMLSDS
jgi:hypothetical protein